MSDTKKRAEIRAEIDKLKLQQKEDDDFMASLPKDGERSYSAQFWWPPKLAGREPGETPEDARIRRATKIIELETQLEQC